MKNKPKKASNYHKVRQNEHSLKENMLNESRFRGCERQRDARCILHAKGCTMTAAGCKMT